MRKNALLQAEIRRLEKALKRVTEENMRLRFPLKECLDMGTIPLIPKPPLGPKRREGIKYVGIALCYGGKQYVAQPDHPLRELKPDGSLEVVEIY